MSALTELSKKHGAYGGSTTAESGSALSSLKAKRGLESLNKAIDYGTLKDREDFGKYSELTPSWSLNPRDEYGKVYNAQQNTGLAGVGNKVAKVLAPLSGSDTGVKYQYMTDDEAKNYAYLHNAPGFTKEDAEEYLNSLDLDKRMTTDYEEKLKDYAGQNALTKTISTIGSTGYNAIGGLSKLVNIPGEALDAAISGDKFDVSAYNASSLPQNVGNALSQGVEDSIDGNVGKFLYGAGKSILDSGLQMLLYGPASTFTMGSSAAVSRMRELEDLGASDLQMVVGSALSGAIEMLTEKYSVENLLKSKGIDSLKSFLKEVGKQMFTEGTEEAFAEILNAVVDRTADALGGVSDYKNFVDDYVANGGIEADAGKAYFWQKVKDTGLSALGGAISGGIMGGPGNAVQWSGNTERGNEIAKNGRESDLINLLKEKGRDDLIDKIRSGNKASLGAAEIEILNDASEKAESKKATEEDRKNLTDIVKKVSELSIPVTGAMDLNGNAVKIKNIDFDNETYETDKGTKKFSEVRLTDSLATQVNLAEEIPSEQRESFLENYKGGNIGDYSTYFELAYQYGKAGYEDAAMRLVEEGHLTSEQMLNIYEAGLRDESSQVSKLNSRIKAVETRNKLFADTKLSARVDDSVISYDGTDNTKIDYNSLTDNQKQNVILSQAFAKAFNANVTLFNSKENNAVYNGMHDERTNTIYLDVYSTNTGTNGKSTENAILTTMSHELTHWGKVNAPAAYEELKETILPVILKEKSLEIGGEVTRDMLSDIYSDEYRGLSNEKIEDELVARACENMLQNSEYAKEALRKLSDETKHTFIDKVKDFYKKIVAAIKDILGRADSNSKEYRMLSRNLSELEKAQKLWDEVIKESSENTLKRDAEIASNSEAIEFSDVNQQFSIREEEPPKKTGIAYKVFFAKNGKLYPPMVANPGGEDTPVGVWLNADIGARAADSKTGRMQVKAGGKGTQGGSGSLAFRPGWHLGDVPNATQFARTNPENGRKELFPENFVWAECEYAADVDYQEEAMSYGYTASGKFQHSLAGLPKLPTDGFYRYRTNPKPDTVPWVITGAMKVNRLLTDAETDAICRDNGVEPLARQNGPMTKEKLEKLGFNSVDYTKQYSIKDTIKDVNGKEYHNVIEVNDSETLSISSNQDKFKQMVLSLAGKDITIYDENEKPQIISFAKENEKIKTDKGRKKVINELVFDTYSLDRKTIVNIQDAIRVSEYDSDMDEAKNHTHDWLAANGWGYRHCYITDGKKIYVAILSIGHSADGRNIMYAVRVNKKGGVDVDETPLNREFDKESPLYNSSIAQNSEDVKSDYGTKNSDISYSKKDFEYLEKSTKKYGNVEKAAIEHFGITKDFRVGGYILRDGTMLDFSGVHWLEGESPEYIAKWKRQNDIRQVDHEDVFEAFEISANEFPSDSRKEFINRGNIRMSPEAPGINIASEPTSDQYKVIEGLINANPYKEDGFYVDIEDKNKRIEKLSYSGNVNASKIVADIKYYYANGKVRDSSLSQFMYSLKDSSGNTLSEGQQRYFKDSKVRDENGNLKVMYHGTYSSPFTIFNPAKSDDRRSLFFTDNESVAKTYERGQDNGTLFKVYLDIKNPLVIDGKGAYWNKIKIADGEIVNVKPRTYRDFTFINQKDADNFAKKFNIEELEAKYDVAKENGTAEYNGENLDKWEIDDLLQEEFEKADKEYRKYRYSNSKKTTFREFFDNYEKYGWYDLEAVLREYDHNAASLEEIKEYSTYEEAVEETKRLFDDYVKEEGEGTFYDDMMASLLPTSGSFESGAEYLNTRGIAERAQREGHDGVIINNISDTAYGGYVPSTIVIAFDSNQVKDITNLNPTENDDIYLSLKDEAAELTTGDMIEIISQNPELKNKYKALYDAFFKEDSQRLDELERLRKTEGIRDLHMINDTKVEKYAKQILKDMNSNVDLKLFTDRLKRFYMLFGDEDVPVEDIQRMAQAMSKNIISNSLQADVNEETKRQITELRKELQKYTISLSDQQKRELRYTYGSDWMKQFIGKVKIRSTGTPLDNTWGELAGRYPYLFGSDTTESDEGVKLAEVLNGLYDKSAYTDAWNDRQREEYEKLLTNELLDGLYTVTNSAAEKYIQKERKLAEQYNRRLVALGLRKGRADNITQEDIFADYAKALREQYDKYRKEYDELQQKRELKRKIIEKSLKLNEKLKKNDKDFHVPDVLKQPLKIVLDALQLQDHPNDWIAYQFSNLRDAFKKIPSQEEALDSLDVYFNTDGYFEEEIGSIIEELNDKMFKLSETLQNNETGSFRLEVLSLASLRSVNDVLTAINVASRGYDSALASSNYERISPRGESSMDFLDKLGKKTGQGGYLTEKLKNFLGWANVTQIYAFDRFGEGGKQTFKGIMEGQDKLALNTKEVVNFAKSVFTGEQAQTWSHEAHEITIGDETYQISTAQIMSLYCLTKRESAKQHLFKTMTSRGEEITGQGIVINAFNPEKGKGTVRTGKILVEREDVYNIIKLLTEEQIKVADKLQEFMSTTCSDWGNYVTMKRFGIMQFTEDNYFPMTVDSENRPSDAREIPQGASIFKMLNSSFTKSLNEKANGALILDSIFDVFNAHANDMAMYNAMGLAVLDAYRWISYRRPEEEVIDTDTGKPAMRFKFVSLKTKMREVYGSDALNWLLTYLEDINGARVKQTSGEALANKIMSNYKTAAVAANVRVALMQPTAYLKAISVMDNKYLSRAFFEMRPSQLKVAIAEMNSKAPLAIWKNELNMYDLNVGRAIEDKVMQTDKVKNFKGAVEKTMEWSMKLAEKADEITWAKLYRACQLEAEDKGIEKGAAFDYAVNERFREVCFRTQVFDSINSRSEMMRRKDIWHKILTSFASEPSLSYSMVSSEVFNFLVEARTNKGEAFANHAKPMARNMVAFLITELAVSMVAALPDVMRDDDNEEEFLKQYLKNAVSNFGSDMVMLPYLRDVVSVIQGFDPSRPDEEIFASAVKAGKSLTDGKWNYRDIYNSLKFVSQLSGIPFSNIVRDIKSAWNSVFGDAFGMKIE